MSKLFGNVKVNTVVENTGVVVGNVGTDNGKLFNNREVFEKYSVGKGRNYILRANSMGKYGYGKIAANRTVWFNDNGNRTMTVLRSEDKLNLSSYEYLELKLAAQVLNREVDTHSKGIVTIFMSTQANIKARTYLKAFREGLDAFELMTKSPVITEDDMSLVEMFIEAMDKFHANNDDLGLMFKEVGEIKNTTIIDENRDIAVGDVVKKERKDDKIVTNFSGIKDMRKLPMGQYTVKAVTELEDGNKVDLERIMIKGSFFSMANTMYESLCLSVPIRTAEDDEDEMRKIIEAQKEVINASKEQEVTAC